MATFVLIRHATYDRIGQRIVGRMEGICLNERGRAQAAELGKRLAALPIRSIRSSPLQRTRETACAIARSLSLQVELDDDLNEIDYGEWTGMEVRELDTLPEWLRFNALRGTAQIPGGENMVQVAVRAVGTMERLHHLEPEGWFALISHGDWIRAAVAHYTGVCLDRLRRFEIAPASVSIVLVEASGPRILLLNSTGDLAHSATQIR